MGFLHELLVTGLLVLGASFALVGSFGMIKLPDLMTRLHAPTKATTLGVGGALLASMLHFLALHGTVSIHELLISLFLFLTAPVTAHFLAKAYLHTHPDQELPSPPNGQHWSTFDTPREHQLNGRAEDPAESGPA
ncbi:Na+/H+ antiporter subunit G [Azovibrio restrictus]|jgi:multicomponent K+:H+ antiporter subunit G|uniref:Na+/H+ antiporter subunit G n=1 Tax=Azovibrio restrictus TaxID=146938 RepID=UPI0026EBA0FF|nr:Na+/H+ antiporter subunit G [Azovibrio restrictus]